MNEKLTALRVKSELLLYVKYRLNKAYVLDEFSFDIDNKRYRLDLFAMDNKNTYGYEIKISKQDMLRDNKYKNYHHICNYLYFVIPESLEEFFDKPDVGLIIFDKKFKFSVKKRDKKTEVDKEIFSQCFNSLVNKIFHRYVTLYRKYSKLNNQIRKERQ